MSAVKSDGVFRKSSNRFRVVVQKAKGGKSLDCAAGAVVVTQLGAQLEVSGKMNESIFIVYT